MTATASAADSTTTPAAALPPRVDDALVARLVGHVAGSGPQRRATSPITGDLLPAVPSSTPDDVAAAAARGRAAQPEWAARPVKERAAVMVRFARLVLAERERLLDLVQWETGKSRIHAGIELFGLPAITAHYASEAPRLLAPTKVASGVPGLVRAEVRRQAKGLVGVIAPWNYPLFLAVGDVVPALLAGNAVISKADSQAPLTLLAARDLALRAGLPADLWQVVAGSGSSVGPALLEVIDHLAFTGSTATGRELGAECGRRLIGASLELGGKNPMIVRADADLDAAALGAVQAAFSNAGQICIGVERIYVHHSVHDEFLRRLADRVGAVTLGFDYDLRHEMGSLTNADQLAATRAHIDDAVAHGARVVAGGRARPDLGPLFHEPTVLSGITPEMKVHSEETFGPVVSVFPVADDEEALTLANATDYGLSASVWSRDLAAGRALAARIHAGSVNVNDGYLSAIAAVAAPMGGMKQSGQGRRHGSEGLLRYTETQTLASQRTPMPYPAERAGTYLTAMGLAMRGRLAATSVRLKIRPDRRNRR